MPIMVLNDEGHHCWRPKPEAEDAEWRGKAGRRRRSEKKQLSGSMVSTSSTIAPGQSATGIAICVDLSATPFYIKGSGHPEGRPFPWLVCDFGLVDAIESGIVKIPRLPVQDVTGRPEPKYFKLWETIKDELRAGRHYLAESRSVPILTCLREAEGALTARRSMERTLRLRTSCHTRPRACTAGDDRGVRQH